MRKWYKYFLTKGKEGFFYLPIDEGFYEHAKAMGGYDVDESYSNKKTFFEKYFHNYHNGRLICYDKFIRKHLKKWEDTLSVASGRCANELYLMEDGFNITCSDLERVNYEETIHLFPDFKFVKLNILEGPSERKYDTVICLSLLLLLDNEELSTFFKNVSNSLNPKGRLILDSAGSSDEKVLSNFIHDYFLKYELILIKIIKTVFKKGKYGLIKKHHGYRRSDKEIVHLASKTGLVIREEENYAFLTELRRSELLKRLIDNSSFIEKIFCKIGKRIPYIRMFYFEKI